MPRRRVPAAPKPPPVPKLPAVVEVPEAVALRLVEHVAISGDLFKACMDLLPKHITFGTLTIWLKASPKWENAMAAAYATYAQQLSREAVDVANRQFPWDELEHLETPEKKLYLDAWFKRQQLRIETMSKLAARLAPAQGQPAVAVNVDARGAGGEGAYANLLRSVEQAERGKVIEHKAEG